MKSDVPDTPAQRVRDRGQFLARAVGALLVAGAGLVALSLLLPHPSGSDEAALTATAAAMFVAGLLWIAGYRQIPTGASHLAIMAAVGAAALMVVESGIAAGQYGSIFVWTMLLAGYFFPRRIAFAHLGWLLAVYALALSEVESAGGYSPLTRWLFSAISLSAHGHLVGDELLRECAIAWDSQLRGEDTIVRFGGEEFVVLMPGAAASDAGEIVERLRR